MSGYFYTHYQSRDAPIPIHQQPGVGGARKHSERRNRSSFNPYQHDSQPQVPLQRDTAKAITQSSVFRPPSPPKPVPAHGNLKNRESQYLKPANLESRATKPHFPVARQIAPELPSKTPQESLLEEFPMSRTRGYKSNKSSGVANLLSWPTAEGNKLQPETKKFAGVRNRTCKESMFAPTDEKNKENAVRFVDPQRDEAPISGRTFHPPIGSGYDQYAPAMPIRFNNESSLVFGGGFAPGTDKQHPLFTGRPAVNHQPYQMSRPPAPYRPRDSGLW